jgi:hypothetical protein
MEHDLPVLVMRGVSAMLFGVLVAGLIVLVVGLLWRKPKNAEDSRKESG